MSCRLETFLVASLSLLLTACSGVGSNVVATGGGRLNVMGDENGGKIAEGIGSAQGQAMQLVTSHCAKYEKKGFVTRMDYDSGTIAFECRKQGTQAGLKRDAG